MFSSAKPPCRKYSFSYFYTICNKNTTHNTQFEKNGLDSSSVEETFTCILMHLLNDLKFSVIVYENCPAMKDLKADM